MILDDQAVLRLFDPLWADIKAEDEWHRQRPFLAHYTSLDALEKILQHNEIWFSNPLFMNDFEEVRFGILHGAIRLRDNEAIRAALTTEARHAAFRDALDSFFAYYEREYLLDTYVFCFTRHKPADQDGLLSMWRGYGGNGKGVALVFDAAKLEPTQDSPLIFAKVHYGSADERLAWIEGLGFRIAGILSTNYLPDEQVNLAAYAAFQRVKTFALFTKHHGFAEEKEWRVVYLSERDTERKLAPMLGYANGTRGVEPKLKFKVAHIEGVTAPSLSLDNTISAILLGPSTSSPLAKKAVERMLELIGRPHLKDRVFASSIPFRPV